MVLDTYRSHIAFLIIPFRSSDFTIEDPNMDFNEEDVRSQEFKSALMWAPGVGSKEKSVASSSPHDKNRIDILRLMIAAFCDPLFQSPDSFDSCESLWLEVGTSSEAPYAEIVFYSLMNVVLGYDPVGWGMPYGNLVATDTAKTLMESAIQALVVLLDYGHPIELMEGDAAAAASAPPGQLNLQYVAADDVDAQGFNIFRKLLGSIDSHDHLNFMFRGFSRLLNNVYQSECTYLPYSITKIEIEQVSVNVQCCVTCEFYTCVVFLIVDMCVVLQELMVLLWKCLEEVPKFMSFILT